MSLLIESIRLEHGTFHNLRYHQRRVEDSFRAMFGTKQPYDLQSLLEGSSYPLKGLYKCRIVYDDHSAEISFDPYTPKIIRGIQAVSDDDVEYPFKFRDRGVLDKLYAMRGTSDDVLIIRKGEVTDTSFSNIVFSRSGRWYTPARPLLHGTMRQYLLETGKIHVLTIRKEQIRAFETFRLINAMIGFDSPEQAVADIIL